MTFERRTSAVLGTNFVGSWEGKHLIPLAGIPRLRYDTNPGNVTNHSTRAITAELGPEPDDCFIQIPSIHPGSLCHDNLNEVRRIIEMTQRQLLLGLDVLLTLLAAGFDGSRAQFCQIVLDEMDRRWKASECHHASKEAKTKLQ